MKTKAFAFIFFTIGATSIIAWRIGAYYQYFYSELITLFFLTVAVISITLGALIYVGGNYGLINFKSTPGFTLFGLPNKKYTYDLFVLMPFDLSLKPVYDDHIKKVAKVLNLSIARADDFFSQNSIMYEVWSAITQASILIADCTGKNPNVFYEIGIAHTIGKPVILITQNQADVPFDLRHIRYIQYDYTPSGMIKFENTLTTTISEIKKDLG